MEKNNGNVDQSTPGSNVNSQPPLPSLRVNNSAYFRPSIPPGFDLASSFSALNVSDPVDPRNTLMRPRHSFASSNSLDDRGAYVDLSTQHNVGYFPSSSTSNIDNINAGSGQRMPRSYNSESSPSPWIRINNGTEIDTSMPSRLGYTTSALRPTMNNGTDHYMPSSSFTNNNYPLNPSLNNVAKEHSQERPKTDLVRLAMDQHNNIDINKSMPSRLGYTTSTLRPTMNNGTDHYMPSSSFTDNNYPLNSSLYHGTEERLQESPKEIDLARLAMDQHTNIKMLKMLDNNPAPYFTRYILSRVMAELGNLSLHPVASTFVEKLIGVVPDTELEQIVRALPRQGFKRLCTDQCGNKVMQGLVRRAQGHEGAQVLLMEELRPIVVDLINTPKFIHCCLDYFSPRPKEMLLLEMVNHLREMTTNFLGCETLKRCFPHHASSATSRLFTLYVVRNALDLVLHSSGNYIVQHVVVEEERLGAARHIAEQLRGHFVTLSVNIHGSNVVETLLRSANIGVALLVINELMQSSEADLLMILCNQYGNFVAQTAYEVSRANVDERFVPYYDALKELVNQNVRRLKSDKYGRIVLRNFRLKDRSMKEKL